LWYENQGGTFASPKKLNVEIDRPAELWTSDYNSDGVQDIVYQSEEYKKIAWFETTGITVSSKTMSANTSTSFGETSVTVALSGNSTGSGNMIVSKAERKKPVGSEGINAEYTAGTRVVVRSEGNLEVGEGSEIYFDLNKLPNLSDPDNISIFKRDTVDRGTFRGLQTTYDTETEMLSTAIDTTGEIVFANKFPPVAKADTFSVREDDTLQVSAPGVLENDKNPQSVNLDISLVSDVTNGELTFNADGSFGYIPEAEFDSTDSFKYEITDGFSTSSATVTINVETQNVNITYGGTSDWQLVSFPIVSSTKEEVEGEQNWTLFEFTNRYEATSFIEAGKGYWLKSIDGKETSVQQDGKTAISIELESGWNLIGGINNEIALADVIDENDVVLETTLFGFDNGYFTSDTVRAGKGYWLRATEAGTIKLNNELTENNTSPQIAGLKNRSSSKTQANYQDVSEQFNKVILSTSDSEQLELYIGGELPKGVPRSAYSLPPKPPEGSCDARFKDGYRLTEAQEPRLELQGVESLVKMRLETSTVTDQSSYNINIIRNGEVIASPVLSESDPVSINRKNIDHINITKDPLGNASQQDIPGEFHLEQNYPNPFNPSTTIEFGLPKATDIKVSVYNVIGQRVATLADEFRKAGWHTVKFHANDISSGVYFYRLKTAEWTKTRKFLLLK